MSRSYRSLVASRRRQYPHQVRLGDHALDWRLRYITHALIELEGTRHWAQWYEPSGKPDVSVNVYGFKEREHANSFYAALRHRPACAAAFENPANM
jgi:hypothetical protein